MAGIFTSTKVACNGSGLVSITSSPSFELDLVAHATLGTHFKTCSDTYKTILLNRIQVNCIDAGGISDDKYVNLARDLYQQIHTNLIGSVTPKEIGDFTVFATAFSGPPVQKVWDPYIWATSAFVNANLTIDNMLDLFANIRYGWVLSYVNTNDVTVLKFLDATPATLPPWTREGLVSPRNPVVNQGVSFANTPTIGSEPSAYAFTRACFTWANNQNILSSFGVTANDIKTNSVTNFLAPIAYVGSPILGYAAPTAWSYLTGADSLTAKCMLKKTSEFTLGIAVSNADSDVNPELYTSGDAATNADYGWLGSYSPGAVTIDTSIKIVVT